jgi:hypothetical protein
LVINKKQAMKLTLKQIKETIGSLSAPSKMPCSGYSIPAKECKVGSLLREIKGSTCSGCYALEGRYRFKNVEDAMYKRLEAIQSDIHDSGDIQDEAHLNAINEIAKRTPNVRHWLPTREVAIVKKWLENNTPADNLVIRQSAHMNDRQPSTKLTGYGSGVIDENPELKGHVCPASKQDNQCGDCRACWEVETVLYHKH